MRNYSKGDSQCYGQAITLIKVEAKAINTGFNIWRT